MTKRMAKGLISTRMELSIKEAGIRIYRMVMEPNSGLIHPNLLVGTEKVARMALESTFGLTEPSMKDNGRTMR